MHGLQACLFKYITVAAFHIYAQRGENVTQRGGWGHALNSHVNYIVFMENHGIVFLNFSGNLDYSLQSVHEVPSLARHNSYGTISAVIWFTCPLSEGLDGGGGVWYLLFIKNLAHCSSH